jgi:SAM-dependent methyltransferase
MTWQEYIEKSKARPLRPLFVKSTEFLQTLQSSQKVAVDLGCGSGEETQELLRLGWEVFAFDKEPTALKTTESGLNAPLLSQLHSHCLPFEEISELPKNYLVHSYHALPFCDVDHFDRLLQAITESIVKNGFFVGTFFGNNDEWVRADRALGVNRTELEYHFGQFEFIHFRESDHVGSTLLNGPKHWHVIELIARKK